MPAVLERKKEDYLTILELLDRLSSLGNSPRYIKLLKLLLERAGEDGIAYLTHQEGEKHLGVDTRTYYRIVKRLIQRGFIQKAGINLYKVNL